MSTVESRGYLAARATAVTIVFNYAGMAASFVTVPLLLHWLGQTNYGLVLTAQAFASYLSLADIGLGWGAVVLVSEAHGRGDRVGLARVFRHNAVLSVASAVVAMSLALAVFEAARQGWRLPMFADQSTADGLVLVVAAQCALNLATNSLYGLFVGVEMGHWTSFYQGCVRLGSTAAVAATAWAWRAPAPALVAGLAVNALGAGAALVHARQAYPWIFMRGSVCDAGEYRRQLRTGTKSFALGITRVVQGTAPVFIIGSLAGPAAVPLYSVPATLVGAAFGIFTAWNANVQAAYGASWVANDRSWVIRAFQGTLDLTLVLGTVALAGFTIAGPPVIALWTHGALQPSTEMCASVAAVALVQAVAAAVQFCLVGINQHRNIAFIELVHTATALAGAALTTAAFGPAGVGLGMTAAYGATAAWWGFRDLATRLGSRGVMPRPGWLVRVAVAGAAGIAAGATLARLWPVAGGMAEGAAAFVEALLVAGVVVAGTILLRIKSAADWAAWAAQVAGFAGRLLRVAPGRGAAAVD
jgi:O-antigen/teichoic acid export membrane protein